LCLFFYAQGLHGAINYTWNFSYYMHAITHNTHKRASVLSPSQFKTVELISAFCSQEMMEVAVVVPTEVLDVQSAVPVTSPVSA